MCDICGPNAGVVRVLRAPTELTRNAILAAVKLLCSGVVLEGSRAASQPASQPAQARAVGFTTRHSLFSPISTNYMTRTKKKDSCSDFPPLPSLPPTASDHVLFPSSIRRSMVLTSVSVTHYNYNQLNACFN